ncbi:MULTISPECIES: YscO family type III secretion system apparatus protein [unclassified Mesorhizobium]|uniref:type III secretion system stalk subunit SctO n=1 Tax=unclassified Mesorhizobium TaxID=325217 RepID=UPI0013DF8FD4|nr:MULTISPECIES: YscO family type III secretion system apparatus protein [unclassified Mesorhizobium]
MPKAVHRLLELKELRRCRAEDALRLRHIALDNTVAAIEKALTELRAWREDRSRREAAVYDPLIGEAVALIDLNEVNAKMISLRQHEQLLQKRLEEATAESDLARQAREEAYGVLREAWREVRKFENLVRALETDATLAEERSADLELEDFAQRRNSLGREQDDNPSMKLHRMWSGRPLSAIRRPRSAQSIEGCDVTSAQWSGKVWF